MEIRDFLQKLTKLHRANVAGKGRTPHKPVLLLALADWFEVQSTACCTIPFDERLVEADTAYSLKKLDGRKIRLPKEEGYWPGNGFSNQWTHSKMTTVEFYL